MTKNAPAKINLGLHVLRKRGDGFHEIETVFLRVPWIDMLHAEAAEDLRMTCTDPSLPADERNLVLKAAIRLRQVHGISGGAYLHLEKHIPYGAGLGGGSSDAAAALVLLNDLWSLGLDEAALASHALELGSDVPFFLSAECAVGTGRGERLEPLIDPTTAEPFRPPWPLVIAVPEERVSTAEAYSIVSPDENDRSNLREIILSKDLARWRSELTNDFEAPILDKYPAIAYVKSALEAAGARYAAMSGSGSAVFGFFHDEAAAGAAADALRQSGHRTWRGVV